MLYKIFKIGGEKLWEQNSTVYSYKYALKKVKIC